MFDFDQYVREKTKEIDAALDNLLPAEDARPRLLHKAMRYSMFSGGKRLRPLLCVAAAQAVGDYKSALPAACAIEAIHTYSLIHDDLPALDDDKERRGKPTSHIVFGEAQAILAGDALLTAAFEWLAISKPTGPVTDAALCLELALAAGSQGMVGGQVEDVLGEGKKPSEEQLLFIHRRKTVALIRATVRMGALAAGASADQLEALTAYGEKLGLARQFIDDIEDVQGQKQSSDMRLKKMTAVTVYGLGEAKQKSLGLMRQASAALDTADFEEPGKQALAAAAAKLLTKIGLEL